MREYLLHFSVCPSCPTPSSFACCSKTSLVSGVCEDSSEFQCQGLPEALLLLTFTATSSPGRSPPLGRIFIFAVTKHECLLKRDRSCAALSQPAENNIGPDNSPLPSPICSRIRSCPSYLHYLTCSMLPWWLGLCGNSQHQGYQPLRDDSKHPAPRLIDSRK